jgi:cardiolipin synthase
MGRPLTERAKGAERPSTPSLAQLLKTPNLITLSRLFLIPVFLSLLSKQNYTYALYLFLLAALTDALDGTVARWSGTRTQLGAFLDPFADKLLLISAFVVLTLEDALPGWALSVVVIRDVVIVFGYFMIAFFTGERMPVRPSYLGKTSTVLQLACIVAVLSQLNNYSQVYWYALLYLTVGITALSGVHYAYRGLNWLGSREPSMFS